MKTREMLLDRLHSKNIATASAIGLPVWSPEGGFIYYQEILEEGEPDYRFNVRTGSRDTVARFNADLSEALCVAL